MQNARIHRNINFRLVTVGRGPVPRHFCCTRQAQFLVCAVENRAYGICFASGFLFLFSTPRQSARKEIFDEN